MEIERSEREDEGGRDRPRRATRGPRAVIPLPRRFPDVLTNEEREKYACNCHSFPGLRMNGNECFISNYTLQMCSSIVGICSSDF